MSIPNLSLEGKVAIVTGGKRGIGKAIALTFAGAGADVAICSRTDDGELSAAANEIEKLGRRALAIPTDITRKSDVNNLVRKTVDGLGEIDILVNNAGNLIMGPLLDFPEADWDATIDTHLKGYYFCSQAVGRRMVKQKRGNIINIASTWGEIVAEPRAGGYCIAKAGVVIMTRILARELAQYNIRVNAISPGSIRTAMNEPLISDPEALKQYEARIPLGRIGEPTDIANTALFLACEASSFITGHTFIVDGGLAA